MRNRRLRALLAILTALLTASTTVQAGPVVISEVIQTLVNVREPAKVRLDAVSEYDGKIAWETGKHQPSEFAKSTTPPHGPSNLFAGLAIIPNWQEPTTEPIGSGSVQGTICDCGEIILAGGFPKWPLLFLAAVPLFFIPGDHTETPLNPTPTPPVPVTTPVPVPTPVPEPASLLLLGTGLAAFGVRLRRRKVKNLVTQNQTK